MVNKDIAEAPPVPPQIPLDSTNEKTIQEYVEDLQALKTEYETSATVYRLEQEILKLESDNVQAKSEISERIDVSRDMEKAYASVVHEHIEEAMSRSMQDDSAINSLTESTFVELNDDGSVVGGELITPGEGE